jgi:diaminopimelate epimerase
MKEVTFYKYQGAGNDFLIADNRDGGLHLTVEQIAALCDRRYGVGADGLMLLEKSPLYDFRMVYYNSDGSGGMMCGNGGRCMVAFAADMGIENFDFEAADGFHTAQILASEDGVKTVRLKMKDVTSTQWYEALEGARVPSEGCFMDTGTRHYVRFVSGLEEYDIVSEGRDIRYNAEALQPVGANVNYVEPYPGGIKVRTYEKGVEDETFACGTGIVASCVASYGRGLEASQVYPDGRIRFDVKAKRDNLSVDFMPSARLVAEDVWLTGPAAFIAKIIVDLN